MRVHGGSFLCNEVKTHNFKVSYMMVVIICYTKRYLQFCRFSKNIISFIQICAEKTVIMAKKIFCWKSY